MDKKKLLDLPEGFPQPSEPESIEYFPALCTSDAIDIFANTASLAEAREAFKDFLCSKAPGVYSDQALVTMSDIVMQEWLEDCTDRHEVPWFSEGIKAELKAKGIPVTKQDELRQTLVGFSELTDELTRRSIEDVAEDIAEGVLLNSPYYGNYCGYPPDLIATVLRELIALGKIASESSGRPALG